MLINKIDFNSLEELNNHVFKNKEDLELITIETIKTNKSTEVFRLWFTSFDFENENTDQ